MIFGPQPSQRIFRWDSCWNSRRGRRRSPLAPIERTLNDSVVEFGVSGMLRNSDLIMYDRTTETLWQQFTGKAIVGGMVGARLTAVPAPLVSYQQFRTAFPDGLVLSTDTDFAFASSYGINPYGGYDSGEPYASYFPADPDPRLPATERVVALELDDGVAYPFSFLREARVVNDTRGGREIVVVWTPGAASALDTRVIADARDVGAGAVFSRELDGRLLTFLPNPADEQTLRDEQTGSVWNIFGAAVAGELAGAHLTPVVHCDHFWFAWAAFFPNTALVQG